MIPFKCSVIFQCLKAVSKAAMINNNADSQSNRCLKNSIHDQTEALFQRGFVRQRSFLSVKIFQVLTVMFPFEKKI